LNTSIRIIALAVACVLAAPDLYAQKLYRWVDKDGKVHYSDTVPPSEVDQARDELNTQGRTVDRVDRAMTEAELAEAAEAAAIAEQQRKAKEAEEHMDSVLLSSYDEEADLKRAYDERFDLVAQSIESARVGIRSQEKSLADILAHAADLERAGKPVSENIQRSIEISRKQVSQQSDYLADREAEQSALQKEYDDTLARYRRLKALQQEAKAKEKVANAQ
jgi:hypothetical protein